MNVQAYYEIYTKDTSTGEMSFRHKQKNLITDYGLNYFGSNSTTRTSNSNWEINTCAVWLKDIPEPTTDLEELRVPYATGVADLDIRTKFRHNRSGNWDESTIYKDDGTQCYIETTRVFKFTHKDIVGDIHGVYLGSFNSISDGQVYIRRNDPRMYPWEYNNSDTNSTTVRDHVFSIFSAIRLKNESGNHITIPVREIEELYLKYTLRRYLPKYIPPKVYTLDTSMGTQHKVTVTPRWWDYNYNGPYWSGSSNIRSSFDRFSNSHGSHEASGNYLSVEDLEGNWTTYHHGQYNNPTSTWASSYVDRSYKQTMNYHMNLNAHNKTIKSFVVYNTMGTMHLSLNPPIEKNNERLINFAVEWQWGREDDLMPIVDNITIQNPTFDPDLSDWTAAGSTPPTDFELDGVKVAYLSETSATGYLKQKLDVSSFLMQDKVAVVMWDQKTKDSVVDSVELEYLSDLDEVLSKVTLTRYREAGNYNEFTEAYVVGSVPEEAFSAQSINLTFYLKCKNTSDPFIAISNIRMNLTNMIPVEV